VQEPCKASIHTDENQWIVTLAGRKYFVIAAAGDHYWAVSARNPGHRPATIHIDEVVEVAPNPLGKRP
jgi:hypothetical protein